MTDPAERDEDAELINGAEEIEVQPEMPVFPDARECCLILMVPKPHWRQDSTLILDDIRPEEAARVLRSFADRLDAAEPHE